MSSSPTIFPNPIFSGDPISLVLLFTGDQTGKTFGVTVKTQPSQVDTDAIYKQDVSGDVTGQVGFAIPGLNVGSFWIDVKMWDAGGVRSTVIPSQKFLVEQSVTARAIPGTP